MRSQEEPPVGWDRFSAPVAFWGTVGNATLAGAGSGGITSLLTGQNFLEGVVKGAVIGGVVAGITYTMNYYANGYDKVKYKTTSSNISETDKYGLTYDNNISQETMQNNVDIMRSKNFTLSEMNEFGVGTDTVGFGGHDGYIYPGNGTKVFAYTTPKNFWTGKSNIVYAPITAQNKELLAATMVHETGHAYAQKLGLLDIALDTKSLKINPNLNTTEHWAISKLEHIYADKNLISMTRRLSGNFYTNPDDTLEAFFNLKVLRSIVDETSKNYYLFLIASCFIPNK